MNAHGWRKTYVADCMSRARYWADRARYELQISVTKDGLEEDLFWLDLWLSDVIEDVLVDKQSTKRFPRP